MAQIWNHDEIIFIFWLEIILYNHIYEMDSKHTVYVAIVLIVSN